MTGQPRAPHWSGWVESVHPATNKYGERLVKNLCTGALQFLSSAQTKIELQENQRSDRIIDTLVNEEIFPPALSDSWVLGDPDYRQAGSINQARQSGSLQQLRRRRADPEHGG